MGFQFIEKYFINGFVMWKIGGYSEVIFFKLYKSNSLFLVFKCFYSYCCWDIVMK